MTATATAVIARAKRARCGTFGRAAIRQVLVVVALEWWQSSNLIDSYRYTPVHRSPVQSLRRMATGGGTESLAALRMKYKEKREVLLEAKIPTKDPFCIFREWLDLALNTAELQEPNAACLATVSSDGMPSNRYVLLKDVTAEGFTFFTNYGSRKAEQIAANPNVAMTLYWCPLRRSVRIEGVAEKIPHAQSLAYFHVRPRMSQIGALASPQSSVVPSREHLDKLQAQLVDQLQPDLEVPMPNWGGYLIRPRLIEFWQGQSDRLHDRIRFRRGDDVHKEVDGELVHAGENGWVYERLAP